MNLKPTNKYIHARMIERVNPDNTIVLPDNLKGVATDPDHRPLIQVLAKADDVTFCDIGDFLLMRPGFNGLAIDQDTILFHADSVIAVVLDDSLPTNLN